jgi:hypothetical protein
VRVPRDRLKLGFLDRPEEEPLPPPLRFFLDPRGSYGEMVAYRFLLMSFHAQQYLLQRLPRVRDLMPSGSIPREVGAGWDPNISIIPMDGMAYQDGAPSAPPLILYERFRCRELQMAEDESEEEDEEGARDVAREVLEV